MATFTNPTAFANNIKVYGFKIEARSRRATEQTAKACSKVVERHGSRFHIKGRSGRGFGLGAKVKGPYGARDDWIAYVQASPPGFWAIVEKGSYKKPGGYDIYPRRRRRGSGGKKAVTVPQGIFAHVHHPHFGPIGHPWEQAMIEVKKVGPQVFNHELAQVFGVTA